MIAQDELVFYTCFFGDNHSVANNIPNLPTTEYDCYYFTNNLSTYNKLKNTGWNRVFMNDTPIKETFAGNSMDCKEIKSCPHKFQILNQYKYSCYFDSKLKIDLERVKTNLINLINTDKTIIFAKHPFIKSNNVWDEFNESMKQPRYFDQKEQYENYINRQVSQGLMPASDIHHASGFIIRKHCEMTNQINEEWYKHIKECGIQCQISFFFVQQMYKSYIYPVEYYDGFYDIYHNDYWK
jgi:hypothetical protein